MLLIPSAAVFGQQNAAAAEREYGHLLPGSRQFRLYGLFRGN